jgi:hypothetical protein
MPIFEPKIAQPQRFLNALLELILLFLLDSPLKVSLGNTQGKGRRRFLEKRVIDGYVLERSCGVELSRTAIVCQILQNRLIVVVQLVLLGQSPSLQFQSFNYLVINISAFLLLTTSIPDLLHKLSGILVVALSFRINAFHKPSSYNALLFKNLLVLVEFGKIDSYSQQLQE